MGTATYESAPNNANPILKAKLSSWKETLDVTPEERQKYIESKERSRTKAGPQHPPPFNVDGDYSEWREENKL